MNEEILDQIEEARNQEDLEVQAASLEEVSTNRFLIFSMNENYFAIDADLSREILTDMNIYPLPFVPKYIKGLINRQGDAYTVVDPMVLQNKEAQNSDMFIIIKMPTEHFSIMITDIIDFCDITESEINSLPDSTGITCFSSSFLWKGREVLVVDVNAILERIVKDLGNE